MKRIIRCISVSLVLCLCVVFSSCSSNNTLTSKEKYDQKLIHLGKDFLDSWEFVEGRTYSVKIENGIYVIDINGDIQKVQISDFQPNHINHTAIKTITDKDILKIIDASKKLVIDYINESSILREKQSLIQKIEEIEAKYTNADLIAEYADGSVFINEKNKENVCEWMIVHELVHYLCEITNNGIENEQYPYSLYNEIMTDLITFSMSPKINTDIISAYTSGYDMVVPLFGIFGEEIITAYFYGYEHIFEKIEKNEFDFYVHATNQVPLPPMAEVVINNSINKWGLELRK